MARASRYLDELKTYRPDIYDACKAALADSSQDLHFSRVNAEAFAVCPDESIDYAVMEKKSNFGLHQGWQLQGMMVLMPALFGYCTHRNPLAVFAHR